MGKLKIVNEPYTIDVDENGYTTMESASMQAVQYDLVCHQNVVHVRVFAQGGPQLYPLPFACPLPIV